MKTIPAIALLLAATLATAQSVFTSKSKDGGFTLTFGTILVKQITNERTQLTLTKSVRGESASQGLTFRSRSAEVETATKNQKTTVATLHATGAVKITRKFGSRETTFDSTVADYQAGNSGDTIKLTGPVTIVDVNSAKKEVLRASGKTATAKLLNQGTSNRSVIDQATLDGNVVVDVNDAKNHQTIHATGNRMIYQSEGLRGRVTLTGNATISGTGVQNLNSAFGSFPTVVLYLNEQSEVISFKAGIEQ